MVYQSKAQIQAELAGVAEVIFVTSLDDDEEGEDVDFEGEDGWLPDDMDPDEGPCGEWYLLQHHPQQLRQHS